MGLGFERPEGSPNSNGLRVYLESLDPTVQCQGLKRVNHFGFTRRPSLPVYSGQRTSRDRPGWSVLCQQETHAAQQTEASFDPCSDWTISSSRTPDYCCGFKFLELRAARRRGQRRKIPHSGMVERM